MKKSLLATSVFLFVSCAFGQSLISHFTQPADGSIAVESDAIGQSEQRQAQNGLIYVCLSVPNGNPTMTLNGLTVTGTFSGNNASVVEAFQNMPSSGSGYVNFPYAYDVGGVLCGGTKQATLHIPITWRYAITRESFGSWTYNSLEGGCNGSNGITYTNFTARCNGGVLNPDFKSGQENQCSVTTPPTGLWGFDVQTPCIYPTTTNRAPYFCLHSPLGVIWPRTSLESPAVPVDTPGVCTFNGSTQ